MLHKRKFITDSVVSILATFGAMFLFFVIGILIARLLGPTGKGEMAILTLIPSMVFAFTHFGLSTAATYFLGSNLYSFRQIYFYANATASILCIVVFGLYGFLKPYLTNIKVDPTHITFAMLLLPLFYFGNFWTGILFAYQKIVLANVLRLLISTGIITGGIILWSFGVFSIRNLLIVYVLSQAVQVVGAWAGLWNYGALHKFTLRNQWPITDYRKFFVYGFKSYMGGIFHLFNVRMDYYIILYFLAPQDVGLYSVAVALSECLWIFCGAVGGVVLSYSAGKHLESKTATSRVAAGLFYLNAVGASCILILSGWLVPALYGKEFAPSIIPLMILLPGAVLYGFVHILNAAFAGKGRPQNMMYIGMVVFVSTISLDLILIPTMGIIGAALAATLSHSLGAFIAIWLYKKMELCTWRDFARFPLSDVRYLWNEIQNYLSGLRLS